MQPYNKEHSGVRPPPPRVGVRGRPSEALALGDGLDCGCSALAWARAREPEGHWARGALGQRGTGPEGHWARARGPEDQRTRGALGQRTRGALGRGALGRGALGTGGSVVAAPPVDRRVVNELSGAGRGRSAAAAVMWTTPVERQQTHTHTHTSAPV